MLFPRKMKFLELTVMKNDMDIVLEYIGRKAMVQFPEAEGALDNMEIIRKKEIIDRLAGVCNFLGVEDTDYENNHNDDDILIPADDDLTLVDKICSVTENLKEIEYRAVYEKQRIRETINEAKAFSKMNMPFADFEHLSYLTVRLGRLDQNGINELRVSMGDRAVIIPFDNENRFLAACSKKGRFALDSQLKKLSFEPITIPENYRGIPAEMMKSLNEQYSVLEKEIEKVKNEKEQLRISFSAELKRLVSSMNIALIIEKIKGRFTATENLYHFSGWTPADMIPTLTKDISKLTDGRVAVHSYSPHEVPSIKNGNEKVPVVMKHGAFVKGFESVVFSYGAPLYGTIDPTPIVAFFFTLMFGIMFGDAGQGFILFLLGIIINKSKNKLAKLKKYSIPLMSVGVASMIMGLLAGSVFANEQLLVTPTRIVTEVLTGQPMDRILHILPIHGTGGSVTKLLYFFAFTVSIGVIINSLGLFINIFNRCKFKKYREAFFSKTGLAGLLLFWYALFIAVRLLLGGQIELYDYAGIFVPITCIFFGPVIWRIFSGERPVLNNGIFSFFMEGFVEVIETVSAYLSNTLSFLRVGAFALAHAVFSFIVFYFTDELSGSGISGTLSAALIMITGNAIIIVLEGLIVAIQVIRLQYYEFFNKFFVETGAEFAPFRFQKEL